MRYWTSDLHFGHANIIDYCPGRKALLGDVGDLQDFSVEAILQAQDRGVSAMNEELIRLWNVTVGPHDQVMIVGDLCMGDITNSLACVSRLNGHKYLIPGNHDRVWAHRKGNGNRDFKTEYENAGLQILDSEIVARIDGQEVAVCHFPYRGDSHDQDRFTYARPFDEGKILICGHVHDSWYTNGRQINVGTDVNGFRPVSEDHIAGLIEAITVNHGSLPQ